MWELDYKENRAEELIPLNCGVGEDSWVSLGLQGDPTILSYRISVLGVHWKDWCWSWKLQYFGHLMWRADSLEKTLMLGKIESKRRWDNRGWDYGWTASATQWRWVSVDSGSWWWIGRPGVLRFMESQRVGHDWATKLNWISFHVYLYCMCQNFLPFW